MNRLIAAAALLALAATMAACQPAAVSCTLKSDKGDTIGYHFVPAGIDVAAEVTASKNGLVYRHDPNNPPLSSTRPAFANQPLLVITSQTDRRYELIVQIPTNRGRAAAAHMYLDGQPIGAGHCIYQPEQR
jgi:hypothetical protein